MNLKHAKGKKSDMNSHTWHDSIYLKYPENVNPEQEKADCWLPGPWRSGL